jgi:hypothetical protein
MKQLIYLISLSLILTACEDGGGGSAKTAVTSPIAGVFYTTCSVSGGNSSRMQLQLTTSTYQKYLIQYSGTSCAGSPTSTFEFITATFTVANDANPVFDILLTGNDNFSNTPFTNAPETITITSVGVDTFNGTATTNWIAQ